MLATNGTHHNGHTTNGHYLNCPSDYEPRPIIDVVAKTPSPKWRDQLAPVTWSMSYLDTSGISHSVTLRGDTPEEVMDMVKPLVAGIRKAQGVAQQKAAVANPDTSETQGQSDVQRCTIHAVDMPRRWSKRTNGHWFGHKLSDGSFCYGRAKK